MWNKRSIWNKRSHHAAVYSEEYLEGVKKTPHMTLEDLKEFTLQYGDVYFHPVSPLFISCVLQMSLFHSLVVLLTFLIPIFLIVYCCRISITAPSWLQDLLCNWWTVSWQGRSGTAWLWLGTGRNVWIMFCVVYFMPLLCCDEAFNMNCNIYRRKNTEWKQSILAHATTGKKRTCFLLSFCRPPGHHSMRSAASGFCVFNNVAIAARYAKQKHGAKRYFDLFFF